MPPPPSASGAFRPLVCRRRSPPARTNIADLPLLTAAEQAQLAAWNETGRSLPHGVTIVDRVADQARSAPHALAVADGDLRLSYSELHERAGRLAHTLCALGAGPEARVALCMERSAEMVVAQLAVLRTGAAYVPLDPAWPAERLHLLLHDTGAPVLLTQEKRLESLSAQAPTVLALPPGGDVPATGAAPEPAALPGGLAYVIYTSGSTGRPKGVAVEHGTLLNLVLWHQAEYGLGEDDRTTLVASPAFDASVWEIWPTLAAGASLWIPGAETRAEPSRLVDWIVERAITVSFLPTPLAEAVLQETWPTHTSLRFLLTGGDRLARRAPAGFPAALVNHYGPTENTVVATAAVVAPQATGLPAIGRPIANVQAHVLDRRGAPLPVGVPGELHLGGRALARGYLDRPDLTAASFIPDPGVPGGRLYRTGDLVRRRPNGELDFLGRIDHQVKVRGVRIELGEIDAALLACPGVRQAVTVIRNTDTGPQLVAYVSPEDLSAAALKAQLSAVLPDAMVPAAFVALPELPLTANGKVDRAALPEPRIETAGFEAPRTPAEQIVAGIWAELLGAERVGRGDDFFVLGGHSLLAARALARVREALGVDLPLRALFEAPTPAALAQAAAEAQGFALPALRPSPRHADLPLSFAQERLWFLEQLAPGSAAYHIPAAVRLRGELRPHALGRSLTQVAGRHEALRTSFPAAGGRPRQRIEPALALEPPLVDLAGLPPAARQSEAARLAAEEAKRPFDLERGPLVRAALLRLDATDHRLLLTLHHIVADGWSVEVLLRELAALYQGSPLPELPVQYADFAAWQRSWLSGEVLTRQTGWWGERLHGAPSVLELPADHPRPPVPSQRAGWRPLHVPADLTRQLQTLARQEGSTLFMAVLAALDALLHRYTGQQDLVVGTPEAGRDALETEDLIGLFVNTLALRVRLDGSLPARSLLAAVRSTVLDAHGHRHLPFEKLVEELRPERNLSHAPIVQAMLAFQGRTGEVRLPGLVLEPLAGEARAAKFDLMLGLGETADGLAGGLEFSRDLFEPATAERMACHLLVLLHAIASAPDAAIADLPLLTAAEQAQLRVQWNERQAAPSAGPCLHEAFEIQAARTPGAVALYAGTDRLTYGELNGRADRLARRLRRLGVGPEMRVGVFLERSTDLVAGLLGILKAGGAYVPLDPAYPADRVAFMLQDAGVSALLVQESLLPRLPETTVPVVAVDAAQGADADAAVPEPLPRTLPGNLAYLIYTSGSTGRPKAVAIEHASAAALLHWAHETFDAAELAGVLAATSISFDLSVFELFVPLAMGGGVVLAENALALPSLPERGRVTLVNTVPSAMAHLVQTDGLPPSVVTVNLAGEPLPGSLVAQIYERETVRRVMNLYGPSEDTTYSTAAFVAAGSRREPTIGRPLPGTRAYVLDPAGQLAAVGVPGELFLGGAGLARGYLGRPGLTAERFVPDPFAATPGARLYRTGDLARFLPDGELHFLGRIDHQVKVRGFRIELGEIEAALRAHPEVGEAVALARCDGGDARLVAYVAPRTGGPAPEARSLREHLRRRLPEFMVPAAIVLLDALPLSPNGKVDRKALPAPAAAVDDRPRALLTPTEEILSGLWSDLLAAERPPAPGDDFFALGGHSLLATRMLARLWQIFGVELTVRSLFEDPSLGALARRINEELRARASSPPPPLTAVPRQGPLPLSFAQQRLWLLDRLQPGNVAFNVPIAFRLAGDLDAAALQQALDRIVERHETLRTTFSTRAGQPVQILTAPAPVALPWIDLSRLPQELQEEELRRQATRLARQPMDLAHGPLLKVALLRLGDREHALMVVMHHVVSDGWSAGNFIRELTALYAAGVTGEAPALPELPVQYADFAAWQRGWLRGEVLERQIAYWKRRLTGAPPILELPADGPRPEVQTFRGATLERSLPPAESRLLRELSRRQGASLFMTVLAGFAILLRHLVQRDDLVIGTDVAGRSRSESEAMIGFFVNQLALRVDLSGNPTFLDLLARIRREALEGYAHQDLPFEMLVDALKVERSLRHSPVFQVKLIMNNTPQGATSLPGLSTRPISIETGTSKLDLVATLTDGPEGLRLAFNYNTDLFAAATATAMMERFAAVLRHAAHQPDAPLAEIEEVLLQSQRRKRTMETTKRRESSFGKFKQVKPKAVSSTPANLVEIGPLQPGQDLPLLVTPATPDLDLAEWAADHREYLDRKLLKHGAILFRGFAIESPEDFERFARAVCSDLFNENGEHPRETINGNVYTPVFYPPDQKLLWHNENSFNLQWPGKILFCSLQPAEQGGETPIVDSRKVFERISPAVRQKFLERGVMYMRNYGDGLGLTWQTVFQTAEREAAEAYCRDNEMEVDWKAGDRARTRMRRPAAARHPQTGEMSWFNQAQHFHVSCLAPETRSSLQALFQEEDLPRNCYYGDGTPIEDEAMREILDAYEELEVVFPWQKGDVVMLDNMLVAHARNPFAGKRKLLVSMGEMINSKDLS